MGGYLVVLARETMENHLFSIAQEHAELASQNVNRDDVGTMQIEMKHSLIAIVMSFTALEALCNELYQRLTQNTDFDSKEFNEFDRKSNGPIGKWKKLAKLAFEFKNPNKELSLPSNFTKALNELRKLRHSIMHYKPESKNTRFLRKTSKNQVVTQELEKFTSNEAKKAINTVKSFLEVFENITGMELSKLDE